MDIMQIAAHTHVMTPPPGLEDVVVDLPVRVMQEGQFFFVWSEWKPNEEERARLAAGESVFLSVMGTQMPPVMLVVGPEPAVAGEKPVLKIINGGKPPECNCAGRGQARMDLHAADCPLRFGGRAEVEL